MRSLYAVLLVALLALAGGGTAQAAPGGRACGGRTVTDTEACCISGTVTLEGKAVAGALVSVRLADSKQTVDDLTSIVENDLLPTYGFALHDAPLAAQPGDTLVISVRYGGLTREFAYKVEPGAQWLDIALDPPAK